MIYLIQNIHVYSLDLIYILDSIPKTKSCINLCSNIRIKSIAKTNNTTQYINRRYLMHIHTTPNTYPVNAIDIYTRVSTTKCS